MAVPERLHDVVSYEIGSPGPGEQAVVAVRFHLRDGSTIAVALPPELAMGLCLQLRQTLEVLAGRPDPASH